MSEPRGAAEYFDEHAAAYDNHYDATGADGYALRMRMGTVLDVVGDGPGEILDAGMGPGRLCVELAARGWTVSGVDVSAGMVEVARTRLVDARERLLCARIESLPFPAARFDVVTATGVLEYSNVRNSLTELVRVLRPGGRAVVSYPNPHAVYGIWKTRAWYPATRGVKRMLRRPNPEMPHGAGEFPPPRFEQELRRSGLEPVSRRASSYLPMLTPLEKLLPHPTIWLGHRLERRGGERGARLFATQIVYEAHKPGEDET
jgi:SAM-dependent methyltransferase